MKKTIFLLAGLLVLGAGTAFAQIKAGEKVSDLDLPLDYKEWPNVFQRSIPIQDNHSLVVRIYYRKETGKRLEYVGLFCIDRDFYPVMVVYHPPILEEPEYTYLLMPRGFFKWPNPEVGENNTIRWQENIRDKFDVEPSSFRKALSSFFGKKTFDEIGWFLKNLVASNPR